ncbi:hypothetical protein [Pseudomonas sp. DC1.2]|nr:hypothetical protein [Pseudomonas sp. DC1.2]MEB0048280.1 hypothetical protein [Pseudomonas sp. Dout3]MEB0099233.1 hypothetical protein [Pseudomonas sp. DC1.2]WPX61207.1 hypothetical protein RHM68_11400 [Pseudomonas sp. DC1.2]
MGELNLFNILWLMTERLPLGIAAHVRDLDTRISGLTLVNC